MNAYLHDTWVEFREAIHIYRCFQSLQLLLVLWSGVRLEGRVWVSPEITQVGRGDRYTYINLEARNEMRTTSCILVMQADPAHSNPSK